jgi:hypothetical protein
MPIPIHSTVAPARRRRPVRLLTLSLLLGAVSALSVLPQPANATPSYTINRSADNGSDSANAIVYTITLTDLDCTTVSVSILPEVRLDVSGIAGGPVNKWFEIRLNFAGTTDTTACVVGNSLGNIDPGSFAGNPNLGTHPNPGIPTTAFQLVQTDDTQFVSAGLVIRTTDFKGFDFSVQFDPTSPPPTSSSSPAPDPTAATVAVVAEQVAAGGIAGSASGVRVRGSEVVPSAVSRWLAANQGRLNAVQTIGGLSVVGGTSVVSDGLEVQVGSPIGARADRGVVVPSGGTLGASVTGALVPGSVVEVWINSQPRLVAAARVPEDGGTVAFAIPTGAPLDGGGAIEDGAHTLELRMYTEDGFEVVATGITIGQVVPTRIPAGEGPVPSGAVLFALLGAAGVVVAGRRLVTAG